MVRATWPHAQHRQPGQPAARGGDIQRFADIWQKVRETYTPPALDAGVVKKNSTST
jgi:hypothetical protein